VFFVWSSYGFLGEVVLTEKEGGIKESGARLSDGAYAQLGIPLGDHDEHGSVKEAPMRQAEDGKHCYNNLLTIP
jgi:hypothetical protein